jgi:hypothetical protein
VDGDEVAVALVDGVELVCRPAERVATEEEVKRGRCCQDFLERRRLSVEGEAEIGEPVSSFRGPSTAGLLQAAERSYRALAAGDSRALLDAMTP